MLTVFHKGFLPRPLPAMSGFVTLNVLYFVIWVFKYVAFGEIACDLFSSSNWIKVLFPMTLAGTCFCYVLHHMRHPRWRWSYYVALKYFIIDVIASDINGRLSSIPTSRPICLELTCLWHVLHIFFVTAVVLMVMFWYGFILYIVQDYCWHWFWDCFVICATFKLQWHDL